LERPQSTTPDPDATPAPARPGRVVSLRHRADKLTQVIEVGPDGRAVDVDVAALCRVSSAKQEDGFSLEAQRDKIVARIEEDYVAKRGLRVRVHVYSDVNTHDDDDRPMLDQVARDIRPKGIAHVWIMILGRFERGGIGKFFSYKETITSRDALLNYTTMRRDAFEPPDETEELQEVFEVWQAKREKAHIILQTTNGKDKRRAAGMLPGSNDTYGLIWRGEVKPNRPKPYHRAYQEPHPRERQIVLDIFLMYRDEGLSMRAIARRLNERREPSPGAAEPDGLAAGHGHSGLWQASTVAEILGNEAYIGIGHRDKWEQVPGQKFNGGRRKQRLRPRSEWTPAPGAIRPDREGKNVVPDDLFEDVRRLRAARRSPGKPARTGVHLLAGGYVRCAYCQTIMAGRTQPDTGRRPGYRTYQCCRQKAGDSCYERGGATTSADRVEEVAWAAMEWLLDRPEEIARAFERMQADDGPAAAALDEAERRQALARARVEAWRDEFNDAVATGRLAGLRDLLRAEMASAGAELAASEADVVSTRERLAATRVGREHLRAVLETVGEARVELRAEARALGLGPSWELKRRTIEAFRLVVWVRKAKDGSGPRYEARAHVPLPERAGPVGPEAGGEALPVSTGATRRIGQHQARARRPDPLALDRCLAIPLPPDATFTVRRTA
jgi:hypothetical protein